MADIRIHATCEEAVQVDEKNAIRFLGAEGPRVLSTPHMIGYMEGACRNLVLPMLDAGHDTVGTHVNVYHRAAAPMGSTVKFSAELIGFEGKRVEFRVAAQFDGKMVGEGTHQRAIIDVRRFKERVEQ